eukprot:3110123-Amphidinium_carterae.2
MEMGLPLVLKFVLFRFRLMCTGLGLGFGPSKRVTGWKVSPPLKSMEVLKDRRSTFDVVALATSMWSQAV